MSSTARAVQFVDVGNPFVFDGLLRIPSFNLDIPDYVTTLIRSIRYDFVVESFCTRAHPKNALQREPWTSEDVLAVQRLPR